MESSPPKALSTTSGTTQSVLQSSPESEKLRLDTFSVLNDAAEMERVLIEKAPVIKKYFPVWQEFPPSEFINGPKAQKSLYARSLYCIALYYQKHGNDDALMQRLTARGIGKGNKPLGDPPSGQKSSQGDQSNGGVSRWRSDIISIETNLRNGDLETAIETGIDALLKFSTNERNISLIELQELQGLKISHLERLKTMTEDQKQTSNLASRLMANLMPENVRNQYEPFTCGLLSECFFIQKKFSLSKYFLNRSLNINLQLKDWTSAIPIFDNTISVLKYQLFDTLSKSGVGTGPIYDQLNIVFDRLIKVLKDMESQWKTETKGLVCDGSNPFVDMVRNTLKELNPYTILSHFYSRAKKDLLDHRNSPETHPKCAIFIQVDFLDTLIPLIQGSDLQLNQIIPQSIQPPPIPLFFYPEDLAKMYPRDLPIPKIRLIFKAICPQISASQRTTMKAIEFAQTGNTELALNLLNDSHLLDPHDPNILYQIGTVLFFTKQYEKALKAFIQCESHTPGWKESRSNIYLLQQVVDKTIVPEAVSLIMNLQGQDPRLSNLSPLAKATMLEGLCGPSGKYPKLASDPLFNLTLGSFYVEAEKFIKAQNALIHVISSVPALKMSLGQSVSSSKSSSQTIDMRLCLDDLATRARFQLITNTNKWLVALKKNPKIASEEVSDDDSDSDDDLESRYKLKNLESATTIVSECTDWILNKGTHLLTKAMVVVSQLAKTRQ